MTNNDKIMSEDDQYAFIGWIWTCTFHPEWVPDEESVTPLIKRLGQTEFGWRFDASCRNGWSKLSDDAIEFAKDNLLPLCNEFLRGCLIGDYHSR